MVLCHLSLSLTTSSQAFHHLFLIFCDFNQTSHTIPCPFKLLLYDTEISAFCSRNVSWEQVTFQPFPFLFVCSLPTDLSSMVERTCTRRIVTLIGLWVTEKCSPTSPPTWPRQGACTWGTYQSQQFSIKC